MNAYRSITRFSLVIFMLFSLQTAYSAQFSNHELEKLLESDQPPEGVVFELLSGDKKTWSWAAPMISEFRQRLKSRFPDIEIAVVSHGAEQFQLTRTEAEKQPEAIASLRSLNQEGVNLHVCGTHSSWRNIDEDAYIDIVDVSPSGPAQINDYVNLGYTHILLRKPMK